MTDDLKAEIRKRINMKSTVSDSITDDDRDVLDSTGRVAQTQTRARNIDARQGDALADIGFNRVGGETDATRAVYRRGGIVVKFEPMGTWRNENEVTNWEERLPEDASSLFAPVVDHHPEYYWVAMRYADPGMVTPDAHRRLLRALMVRYNLDMTDPHPENVGMLDGRAVLIDYNFRPKEVAETREEREAAFEKKLRDYNIEP